MVMRVAAFRFALAACAVSAVLLACSGPEPETAPRTTPPEAPAPPPAEPSAQIPEPAAPPAAAPVPAPVPAPAPLSLPEAHAPDAAPAQARISLEELGARIKATPAIGTFSKLALKNDIDDLVDDLRGYHEHHEGDLDDLHQRYEALVLKLLALLEDDEPELALALARSRNDIWSRLVNPVEFAKLST
jgi:type IV secretory pathway VirB10-like protein